MVTLMVWIGRSGGFLLQNDSVNCPHNCSCEDNVFNCSDKNFLNVPPIPASGYCEIDLDKNQITTIAAGAFVNLSTCYSLVLILDNNELHTVSEGAFDGVTNNTHELHLRNNNLTSIPLAFRKLKGLRGLALNGNPLKQLDSVVMVNIGRTLKVFNFDMDLFSTWPYQLRFLNVLHTLQLGHIPFKHIPNDAFHGLGHTLRNLAIHDSKLIKIPQAICTLQHLEYFNFTSNHNLDEINTSVIDSCSTSLLKLGRFHFSDNRVTIFPLLQNMFQTIYMLTAENDDLKVMTGDLFTSENFTVHNLYLDRNKFSRIPYAVNHLHSLWDLHMSYNSITGIDELDISKLVDLVYLDLRGNPLMYISHKSFQNNLKLGYLDVSETKLRQIPSVVQYMTNLNSLILDQDPIECTCGLSYLKPWQNISVISDSSLCYLSRENIKDYLMQYLQFC